MSENTQKLPPTGSFRSIVSLLQAFHHGQIVYIAGPYSSEIEGVQQLRYEVHRDWTGKLIAAGIIVYSPIVSSHEISKVMNIPVNWKTWKRQDLAFVDVCGALVVLCFPGFMESVGTQGEIAHAKEKEIPVYYMYVIGASMATLPTLIRKDEADTDNYSVKLWEKIHSKTIQDILNEIDDQESEESTFDNSEEEKGKTE